MRVRHALIPCLRYADAPAAIEFLCRAFGFERHLIHADPDDPTFVFHAELVLNGNMVMLGSARASGAGDLRQWKTPRQADGITMCVYAVIDDPDAHAARAKSEGAEIITRPHDNDGFEGRGYDARDLEGNVWSFGSYDPSAER